MYAGIAVLKNNNMQNELLRPGTDGGSVAEFDGEVDEIHGEWAYVDGVRVGVTVAIIGEEVLDVLLGGCGGIEFAVLLQCKKDAHPSKVDGGRVAGDGHHVLSPAQLAGWVRQMQNRERAWRQRIAKVDRLVRGWD